MPNNFSKGIKCTTCDKPLWNNNTTGFCRKCYNEVNRAIKVKEWLKTGDTGYTIRTTIRGAIRDYIYNDQNNLCDICKCERSWNGELLNFVLDHIDGNAKNNFRENLRLICPNCDSQLDTFKSKNKKSARNYR